MINEKISSDDDGDTRTLKKDLKEERRTGK